MAAPQSVVCPDKSSSAYSTPYHSLRSGTMSPIFKSENGGGRGMGIWDRKGNLGPPQRKSTPTVGQLIQTK